MDIDFQEILRLLGPGSGDLLFNLLLYICFALALAALFTMPDKNLLPTLLIATTLLATLIAKLSISAPIRDRILQPREFGMFIINVLIFVFPLLAVGLVRARKKGIVMPIGIIGGLMGGVYFFLFWFMNQR